ncbi:hypothetical protein [Clostridium botulinum]|nr:hypothetical protein [Clostridium botulinum]APQ76665.1 hypothetical protein RSJ10_436 [Clostridium botulinum]AUM97756.1 hypothetical protein RSJ13_01430 [Clostridium botulinum]
MDAYVPDSSGISSLGGFSYQIRVFVYYMLLLKENTQIEFETIDDVNIKKITPDNIDDNDDNFFSSIKSSNSNIAIQVKRTSITEIVAQKVLLNWILLELSGNEIDKYILATNQKYNNEDILFNKTAEEVFLCVKESNRNGRAVITKVKNKFNNDFARFKKVYYTIKMKYEFVLFDNIDEEIDECCTMIFRKSGINQVVYYERIKELLKHITVQIIEAINKGNPYIFSFNNFMALIEEICLRITEDVIVPLYSDFKRIHKINFKDLQVANSREYKQLVACGLPQFLIEQHLIYCGYYKNLRLSYLETRKISKIDNIEETTFENFQNVKFRLQRSREDEPYNRLVETQKQSNSFADSEQIRFGSSIYLTKEKDDEEDRQISWKDEDE